MVKWIETTGRSEEDAISAALFQLGLERDDVSIEVIERAKSGFLGFGGNPAKVRVSYEVDQEGGSPKPMKDPFQELRDVARPSAPKQEEKKPEVKKPQAPKPQPVRAPKAEEKAAPKAQEETPAQPVEEETILTAKTAWKPASKAARPQRREQRRPRPAQNQLQEGDEVLIGGEKPVHVHKEVTLTPASADDRKNIPEDITASPTDLGGLRLVHGLVHRGIGTRGPFLILRGELRRRGPAERPHLEQSSRHTHLQPPSSQAASQARCPAGADRARPG